MDKLGEYLIEQGKLQSVEEYHERVTNKIDEAMRLIFIQVKDKLDKHFGCFEMFGFDFMLDDDLVPKLLEINVNPALFLDTSSQGEILPKLVQDTVTMAAQIHETPFKKSSTREQINDIFANNN